MSTDRFDHNFDRKVDPKPVRRVEVITGAERRRDWTPEKKRAILAESFEDGVVISDVARRHGLRPQQLFTWRNQFLKSKRAQNADGLPVFAPVMVAQPMADAALVAADNDAACFPRCEGAPALIEIVLGGVSIRLHGGVDGKALTTVLKAVRSAR